MNYLEYYRETMIWSAALTFALTFATVFVGLYFWMRRAGGVRLAQVPCPRGGSALVEFAEKPEGVEVRRCALRGSEACGNGCASDLVRAEARLH